MMLIAVDFLQYWNVLAQKTNRIIQGEMETTTSLCVFFFFFQYFGRAWFPYRRRLYTSRENGLMWGFTDARASVRDISLFLQIMIAICVLWAHNERRWNQCSLQAWWQPFKRGLYWLLYPEVISNTYLEWVRTAFDSICSSKQRCWA